ncbi:MAG: hypothetical protein GF353_27860, partial [Candidatus Lokiarchaeota archaeon]|nr:hypothetical protein [Candidatus Lokiarchaeota archaeon]
MIFQGLFKILEIYLNQIDLFYKSIDDYLQNKIEHYYLDEFANGKEEFSESLNRILLNLTYSLMELGIEKADIENKFSSLLVEFEGKECEKYQSTMAIYDVIAPFIYEIFLEAILKFLVDVDGSSVMSNLKAKKILPIEFIIELSNLKSFFNREFEKKKNLEKYIQVREKIIKTLRNNTKKIENLEHFTDPRNRLQFFYMVFKIIEFFGIHSLFDFTHIKKYIKNNSSEWLDTVPLVSLKNPDLYYCGVYISRHLEVELEEETEDFIKYFLLDIYDENIDEFEAPIIEATNKVYYFFRTSWMSDLELSEGQIKELLKGSPRFFNETYLRNLETSQLVVILKIYKSLGVYDKIDPQRIRNIEEEIKRRITSNGIKQYRDGFVSSEATFYVLSFDRLIKALKSVEKNNFINSAISRIYRNLEILNFSEETNYDLVSELFYSCETL